MAYNKKQYYTIGEFARLCRVNKQTLQYYDRMGIFSPDIVDVNGYRYYAFYQLDVFRILTALKAINTPLKTIREYLNHRSKNDWLTLLFSQQAKIREEIARLELANQIIENKLAQVHYASEVDFDQIRQEDQPAEYLVLSEALCDLDEKQYSKTVAEHIHFCDAYHLSVGYPIGSMISSDNLRSRCFDFSYWFTKVDQPYEGEHAFIKPAGRYVIGYYSGYYGTNTTVYHRIFEFMEKEGLRIVGYAYENSIIDMFMADNSENYVTEVAVHVDSV